VLGEKNASSKKRVRGRDRERVKRESYVAKKRILQLLKACFPLS